MIPIYQIDAFTDKLYSGNPAAVCPLENWLPDDLLQKIAAENNLAETAFFVTKDDSFELRWFTPTTEVALCGHATLASAHVLYEHLDYTQPVIQFHTRKSGMLKVSKSEGSLQMDFPADKLSEVAPPAGMLQALGISSAQCFKGLTDYMLVLDTEEVLDNVQPDFRALGKIDARGVIITAPGKKFDFVSRFFGPAVGVDEDPVTGSAHTTLTPYWSQRLNKTKLSSEQRSTRKGELLCELKNDRVLLIGNARTYLIGKINLQ